MNARKIVVLVLLTLPVTLAGANLARAQAPNSSAEYVQPKIAGTTLAFDAGDTVLPIAAHGPSRAQDQATTPSEGYFQPLVIDIAFPFHAGGETLVAGRYFIEQATSELLMLRSANGTAVEVPVSTRLAQPSTRLGAPAVSFDKVRDSYFISEVWIPGRDGFLLNGTLVPHTHVTLKAAFK
jgi:hypothetical protein